MSDDRDPAAYRPKPTPAAQPDPFPEPWARPASTPPSPRPFVQSDAPSGPGSQADAYELHYPTAYPTAYPAAGWPAVPPAPPRPAGRRGPLLGLLAAAAVATLLLVTGIGVVGTGLATSTVSGFGSFGTVEPGTPGSGGGLPGAGTGAGAPAGRAGTASATQQIGIVTIVSTLKYQQAQSAGTGMILSADGRVLTNNHVIRGSTSVVVTVESTGRSYRATVVGTAPASDVALLQMQGASGLTRAKLAPSAADVQVGDAIIGVGNAGGTGTLTMARGRVTGLDESITAADESGQDAEKLSGLIEVDARIISGDSGGPLYDQAGSIVGMNTAASSSPSATPTAYAIPVQNALALADKIGTGVETSAIHIGYPGFLGVSTKDVAGGGVQVAGLLDGGPAAAAGLTAGSTITSLDGKAVASAAALRGELALRKPGTKVTVMWIDPAGTGRSAVMTLATGPAD